MTPKWDKLKRFVPGHIITLSKDKDKERILKIAIEKQLVTYKGIPNTFSRFFSRSFARQRSGMIFSKC